MREKLPSRFGLTNMNFFLLLTQNTTNAVVVYSHIYRIYGFFLAGHDHNHKLLFSYSHWRTPFESYKYSGTAAYILSVPSPRDPPTFIKRV